MSCTCAGTAPGYPQHESYCGQTENDAAQCPVCCGVIGTTDYCPGCEQWHAGYDTSGRPRR